VFCSSHSTLSHTSILAAVSGTLLACGFRSANGADLHETSASIRRSLADTYAKRQALYLEYRFTSSSMEASPAGQYVRRIIAADRQGNAFLDNSHGHVSMSFVDDPYRKISIIRPTGVEIFSPLSRVIRNYPPPAPKSLLRGLPGELVLLLGWWPFMDCSEREVFGRERSTEALRDDEHYVLLPQAQVIDGALCKVVQKPQFDTIWLDPANAHVIRRRELFDDESGALQMRIEYADFQTIGEDVLVPMSIRILEFDYAAQLPEDRERCLNRIAFHVIQVQANAAVDVAVMAAAIQPPGTIRMRPTNEYELSTGGEEEHARSIADWGRRQLHPFDDLPEPCLLNLLRPTLLSLGAGFAAGCFALWGRSYLKTRLSNTHCQ